MVHNGLGFGVVRQVSGRTSLCFVVQDRDTTSYLDELYFVPGSTLHVTTPTDVAECSRV